jgi:predicted kinase
MEKEYPEKQITVVSQMINLDWLAMLSKADVLGRISKDQNELLDRIELFKEYCEENQCFGKPKEFPDSFSRFFYFRKQNGYSGYKAYDNTSFEVIVMSGLPASGKDTWIKNNNKGMPVVCLDDIRTEIGISPEDNQAVVIQYAKEMAKKYLRKKTSFIWNATNVTKMMREQLVDLFISYDAKVKIVYIEAPYEEIITRNSGRDKPVPEKVIEKLIDKLEVPDVTEAHEVLWKNSSCSDRK